MESKARANTLDPETTERCLGVVKQLLAADCKPNARVPLWKEFGLTTLSVARSIKCQPLVELLESAIPPKPPSGKKMNAADGSDGLAVGASRR